MAKKIYQFTNKEIAQMLLTMSEMLKLLDADHFRILAFEKASRSVGFYAEELVDIFERSGRKALETVPDIGEGIAERLEELFTTGKIKDYDRLKKKVPTAELKFLDIPGVGPKTAQKLYQKFKPKSIDELKYKLKKATPAQLTRKGFGVKTIQNVLRGIDLIKQIGSRHLLAEAEPIAKQVIDFLKNLKEVSRAEAVGSLRRRKETVGDLDFVAATTNVSQTLKNFIHSPFTDKVLAAGDNKATIVTKDGFQLDLELVKPNQYGNLLQHFTGSKDHNVKIRTWAEKRGLSISEFGVKNIKTGKITSHKTEADFYKFLGMEFIPPELREDQGEIEAALEAQLPKLIELNDIKGNLHTHTTVTDGKQSLEIMVKNALKVGFQYLVITDHSKSLGMAKGLDEQSLLQHKQNIDRINKQYAPRGLRVYAGVELNILANGQIDIEDKVLSKLDFVIASVHSSFRQPSDVTTKRLLKAIENPHIDCIGHPSGRKLLAREGITADWDQVFRAAAKNKTLLEINASPNRLDLNDTRIRAAKKAGVKFVINTDAHSSSHYDFMRYGIWQARRGWLEKQDVINAKSANDFNEWLRKHNT